MPTISRETVLIDRRQPILRWSAVFAGAACSVGIWLVLQLLGIGTGLCLRTAADTAESMNAARIATTVWSLIAQVIAMFFGGMVAGKLAQTYERRFAGLHGLVMWALTSVLGMWATIWVITTITAGSEGFAGVDTSGAFDATATAASAADTGRALLVLGGSMVLSLITSVLGAIVALRRPRYPGEGGVRRTVHTTEPGYPAAEPPVTTTVTTTPAYPPPVAGPGTAVIPPAIPPEDLPRR